MSKSDASGAQLEFETVQLGGPPPLRIQYADVPVADIQLDPDNPRLRYKMALNPGKTLDEVLFAEEDTRYLKIDIEAHGLIERPFLRRDGNGKFTAIEGNRRLACFRALHSLAPDDPRWVTMPAKILPPETTEKQQKLLMAHFHVSGKLKWDAHERAGAIYELHEKLVVPEETLKTLLHMGAPAIKQTVGAYKMLMERYAVIDNGKYAALADGKWSFFAEMYKVKWLREKAESDPYWADEFCRWVGDGRLPRAENVRALAGILLNHEASVVFKTTQPAADAFAKAKEIADDSNPSSRSKFYKAVQELVRAGRKADLDDIQMAASNSKARQQLIEARQVLDRLNQQAQAVRT